jgi:hypothetical protein
MLKKAQETSLSKSENSVSQRKGLKIVTNIIFHVIADISSMQNTLQDIRTT